MAEGVYHRLPIENAWHKVTIRIAGGKPGMRIWKNEAGVSWTLRSESSHPNDFVTDPSSPYPSKPVHFSPDGSKLVFFGETYTRVGEVAAAPAPAPAAAPAAGPLKHVASIDRSNFSELALEAIATTTAVHKLYTAGDLAGAHAELAKLWLRVPPGSEEWWASRKVDGTPLNCGSPVCYYLLRMMTEVMEVLVGPMPEACSVPIGGTEGLADIGPLPEPEEGVKPLWLTIVLGTVSEGAQPPASAPAGPLKQDASWHNERRALHPLLDDPAAAGGSEAAGGAGAAAASSSSSSSSSGGFTSDLSEMDSTLEDVFSSSQTATGQAAHSFAPSHAWTLFDAHTPMALRTSMFWWGEYMHAISRRRLRLCVRSVHLPESAVVKTKVEGRFASASNIEELLQQIQPAAVWESETDWWLFTYPSAVPYRAGKAGEEYVTGGCGADSQRRPLMIGDDMWVVRRPPHLGTGSYTPLERLLYVPQWAQHEFNHAFYNTIYPECQLEAKAGHEWFDGAKWPADFKAARDGLNGRLTPEQVAYRAAHGKSAKVPTCNFEPDFYHLAMRLRFLPMSLGLAGSWGVEGAGGLTGSSSATGGGPPAAPSPEQDDEEAAAAGRASGPIWHRLSFKARHPPVSAEMLAGLLESPERLAGEYLRLPVENDWHKVAIEACIRSDGGIQLQWTNAAGAHWGLTLMDSVREAACSGQVVQKVTFLTEGDCPYGAGRQVYLALKSGGQQVAALVFSGEAYVKRD